MFQFSQVLFDEKLKYLDIVLFGQILINYDSDLCLKYLYVT